MENDNVNRAVLMIENLAFTSVTVEPVPDTRISASSGVAGVDNWRSEYSYIVLCIINFF